MSSPAATTTSPSVHPRTGPRTRPCSNCGAAIGFAAKSCKQCKTKTRRGLGLAPLEAASTAARRAGADRREAARIEDRLTSLVGKNLYRVSRGSAGALEASSPEHARFDAAVIKGLDQAAARGAVKVRPCFRASWSSGRRWNSGQPGIESATAAASAPTQRPLRLGPHGRGCHRQLHSVHCALGRIQAPVLRCEATVALWWFAAMH